MSVVVQEMIINKEQAKKLLESNHCNRKIKLDKLRAYEHDMINGTFYSDTGESIKFEIGGILIDGQTRLTAIVNTGIEQKLLVMAGCGKDAKFVIDGGSRTLTDALTIEGAEGNKQIIGSVLLKLANYVCYNSKKQFSLIRQKNQMSIIDLIKFYRIHQKTIHDTINNYYTNIYKHDGTHLIPPSYILSLAVILQYENVDYNQITRFVDKLSTGLNNEFLAIVNVREFVTTEQGAKRNISKYILTEYIIKAWNCFVTNDTKTTIKSTNEIPKIILKEVL